MPSHAKDPQSAPPRVVALKPDARKVIGWFGIVNEAVVEEKFGEQNFWVFSEMRILGKIGVAILDFGRVCRFFYRKFASR